VRRRLRRMNLTAAKIQGFFKMKWMNQVFKSMRQDVMTIQRGVRRFLARRDIVKERMAAFVTHEVSVLNNVKAIENYQLFGLGEEAGLK